MSFQLRPERKVVSYDQLRQERLQLARRKLTEKLCELAEKLGDGGESNVAGLAKLS